VDDLLTTRHLQDLLQVDRVTIYRMLNDGRLHGFKVGGQWRFSRQEIELWLQKQQSQPALVDATHLEGGDISPTQHALPLSCIAAIQGICAEALEIATITTDLNGEPLTEISNSCDFCNLILGSGEGQRRCAAAWRKTDSRQAHLCHAGLLCVSRPIQVSGQMVAIAAGCQFATQNWRSNLPVLASDLGLSERNLVAASSSVQGVTEEYLARISGLLQGMALTFSEIGEERLDLLGRLQHIAEVSKI
jgi:excisionase family DNA binding protein